MNLVLTAFIDENNCIGCSKCIRVCPTDAIVGSKHVLHTIIPKYCTSCEECIAACPTNCIELKTPRNAMDPIYEQQLKQRKLDRLAKSKINNDENRTIHTPKSYNPEIYTPEPVQTVQSDSRKQQIMDAIARVKAKKNKINS